MTQRMDDHTFPNVQVRHASPNYSSRQGAHPTIMVVHATAGHNRPGIIDLVGLGDWFGKTASQVSSHVATDNEGHSARFVADGNKAWHCAGYNRMALGIEQVLPGTGTEITEPLYWETARWLATWSRYYGIPLQMAAVSAGRVTRPGIITHKALGVIGGGHVDPGPGYDMAHLLALSKHFKSRQIAYLKAH